MRADTFIAWRYFRGKEKLFISFLSGIAAAGVFVGVFALIVVISVMIGFNNDLEKKLIGFNAHVVVESESVDDLQKIQEKFSNKFQQSAISFEGEGLIEAEGFSGGAQGVKIRGFDLSDLPKLKDVKFYVEDLPPDLKITPVILGDELSKNLGLDQSLREEVEITAPLSKVGPTGEVLPEAAKLTVVGTFKSGFFEHDSKVAIMPIPIAKKLLGLQGRSVLHLWMKNFTKADKLALEISKDFPEVKIQTWAGVNRKLFSALRLERIAMAGLLTLIIIIASISLVSVVLMYVFSKKKDAAILLSMGMKKRDLRLIFVKIGGLIGLLGSILGVVFGLAACFYLKYKNIVLPGSYYLDYLPVVISWPVFVMASAVGVGLAVLASFYPAHQTLKTDPVESLRYE